MNMAALNESKDFRSVRYCSDAYSSQNLVIKFITSIFKHFYIKHFYGFWAKNSKCNYQKIKNPQHSRHRSGRIGHRLNNFFQTKLKKKKWFNSNDLFRCCLRLRKYQVISHYVYLSWIWFEIVENYNIISWYLATYTEQSS